MKQVRKNEPEFFCTSFKKWSKNRSSRFEPKIFWISFSRGSQVHPKESDVTHIATREVKLNWQKYLTVIWRDSCDLSFFLIAERRSFFEKVSFRPLPRCRIVANFEFCDLLVLEHDEPNKRAREGKYEWRHKIRGSSCWPIPDTAAQLSCCTRTHQAMPEMSHTCTRIIWCVRKGRIYRSWLFKWTWTTPKAAVTFFVADRPQMELLAAPHIFSGIGHAVPPRATTRFF